MSFVQRTAAHCDVCGHEWLIVATALPSHCASCKSRQWNHTADPSAAALLRRLKVQLLSSHKNGSSKLKKRAARP